jgi:cytochrome oxidase Cu insertion factor (SCO1/SenC/PrrC family)
VKKKYYIAISLLILLSLLFACQTAQTQQASTPTQQTTPAETKFNYIDIRLF